jgi:proline dehydrogenase
LYKNLTNNGKNIHNTQVVFSLKRKETDRAYFSFKMIANQPLVRIGTAVTNFALKANLPVEVCYGFDHFGGVNEGTVFL